ncbi:MAG: hypothetical protein AB1609_15065 [Bacillota bacterium]
MDGVPMSLRSRREYLIEMQRRYATSHSRQEKGRIIDEIVQTLGYHRKHAIRCLHASLATDRPPIRRRRPLQYTEALSAIRLVWEALDYPCAERLHPVLLSMAEQLAAHGGCTSTTAFASSSPTSAAPPWPVGWPGW